MAASSPASSNSKVDTPFAIVAPNDGVTPLRSSLLEMPKQNLRGLNKPKCIKCGNVARSRCPYQSCKSCCAKAQNPCHIHVIKTNGTLPEKSSSSALPIIEQTASDVPSSGPSWRLNSLRQLSTNFANSLRAKKPLSRKDAVHINKWRFSKLREHLDVNLEVENEAFERYLQNVSLLEEAFSTGAVDDPPSNDYKIQSLVSQAKLKLRSNSEQAHGIRLRIQNLIDQKLKLLRAGAPVTSNNVTTGPSCSNESDPPCSQAKRAKQCEGFTEKAAAMTELIDKLNKARSADDLRQCLQLKHQLYKQSETKGLLSSCLEPEDSGKVNIVTEGLVSNSFVLGVCDVVNLDSCTLLNIEAEFSNDDQVAQL